MSHFAKHFWRSAAVFRAPFRSPLGKYQTAISFVRGERGVAAVEFALILPLLITLFLGTFEITRAVEINRKVNNAASVVADLVTSSEEANLYTNLDDFFQAAKLMLSPYDDSPISITVSVLRVDAATNAQTVVWSVGCNATPWTAGSAVPVDYSNFSELYDEIRDVVVADAQYQHSGIFSRALNIGDLIFDFQEFAVYAPRTFDQYSSQPSQTAYCS